MNLISIYIFLFSRFVAGSIDSNEQPTDSSSSITNLDIDKIQSQARYDHRLLSKEIKNHIKINNKLSKFKNDEIEQEYGASCYILNKEYYHGQQIKRKNNCEVCLCLDGEIFCWWKKCIFRKKKKVLKDILNSKKNFLKKMKFIESKAPLNNSFLNKTEKIIKLSIKSGMENNSKSDANAINLKKNLTTVAAVISESETEIPVNYENNKCIIMGVSYNIGDILPQDTGNCLQCECTENSDKNENPRITCTPHNCPPLILPDLLDETEF